MTNIITKYTAAAAALLVLCASSASAQSLEALIAAAEATFGGEAYEAGRVGAFGEVQLLSGDQLIETLYDFDSGQLLDSEAFGSPRLVQRVAAGLETAVLSLSEAIDAAEAAVPGEVLEAALLVGRRQSGRVFIVDIRSTDGGIFDVFVESATGRVIRIIRD
jgi:hypothetical protein